MILLIIICLKKLFHQVDPRMLIAALFMKTKTSNNPNTHGHDNGLKIHTLYSYNAIAYSH